LTEEKVVETKHGEQFHDLIDLRSTQRVVGGDLICFHEFEPFDVELLKFVDVVLKRRD
jgi:hypothetical protein